MKTAMFVCLCLIVIASGCIKVDETLTIEKDGSGNLDLAYTISDQTISQMASMFKLRDQMAAMSGQPVPHGYEETFQKLLFDPSEEQFRKEIIKYEKYGIKIDTLRVETKNMAKNVTIKLAFDNLANVAKTDFFADHGFSLSRSKEGAYTFTRAPENLESSSMSNLEGDSAKLLSPILSGFRVALRVTTPGKIFETNATRKTLYNAAWIFDYEKDPNAVTALQKQNMRIVFDGRNIKLPEVRQNSKIVSKPTSKPGK